MGEAKLNRKMNIVLDIDTDKGKIYIHSIPVSRAVFEDNWLVISKAFTAIYGNQLNVMTGPSIAALALKDEAKKLDIWERTQQSLMAEIYRLTNVITAGERGWETMPFDVAKKRGLIDEDDAATVEGCIVYFTCALSIHMRADMAMALEGLNALWGAQTTSLNVTDYMNSLPISMPEETTGESPKVAVNQ